MYDKISVEYDGETTEYNARRIPYVESGRMRDRMMPTKEKGVQWAAINEYNINIICGTFCNEKGKRLFSATLPSDEGSYDEADVINQHPQLWPPAKIKAYSLAAENFQNPKIEDIAKNSSGTTVDDGSSVSQ